MSHLDLVECTHNPADKTPDATVIWLHGLGADGYDFEPIVPELQLPHDFAVRFVFPHAPIRPVTVNMGYEMRSWYDILSMNEVREIDAQQLDQSCRQLEQLIQREIKGGIASERIIVAGFSQGGAVALSTAPCFNLPLAGIIALSTYLPLPKRIAEGRHPANAACPIFWGHGRQDPVVAYALGESARQHLEGWGYSVAWHEYDMPHAVCLEEIREIGRWIADRLRKPAIGR